MITTHTRRCQNLSTQKWDLSHASLDRYGRIALYKQKHHLFGGGFDNFVFDERVQSLTNTNTLPSVERIGAMSIIHSYAKNFNSPSLTLREALQKESYAIHRDAGVGSIFVAYIGNGYTVSFNDSANTPIKYTKRTHISKGKAIHLPYIDRHDGDFYRTFADMEHYLQPHSNQAGWEVVPVISNGKEVM